MCCELLINLSVSIRVWLVWDHHSHMCSQWKNDDKNWWSNKAPYLLLFITNQQKSNLKMSKILWHYLPFYACFFSPLPLPLTLFLFLSQTPLLYRSLIPIVNPFYFKFSFSIPLYFPFHCHALLCFLPHPTLQLPLGNKGS